MALVMSPWLGRGCGRRARPFRFGSPSMFTDLVIVRVPGIMHMRSTASCAPAAGEPKTMSNARVVQWAETPDAHIFKLRLPGLKKEDLQIQVEDDRMLYINCTVSQVKKEETAGKSEGETAKDEQSKPSFMRKFKLPETADLEHIKAEVTNETLTVTVPKLKPKAGSEPRKIDITEPVAATAEKKPIASSGSPTVDAAKPSTSTN